MSDNSPTCILNSSCLQPPPNNRQLASISSDVDSSGVRAPTTPKAGLVRSSGATDFYCERCLSHQQQQIVGGGGAAATSLSNSSCQCGCCPINTLLPVSSGQEGEGELYGTDHLQVAAPKSPKSSRMSGWKTSKFFSKSMTSGEIIRGLKKLSLSSSTSSSNNNSEEQPIPDSTKSLKSRLANLKKRSSCGNEEGSLDGESLDKVPASNKPADSTKTVQDEGIVCKKEDLKAIICSATKRLPLCSPRKKRALRQTKSASFEPPEEKTRKEPVRRAGSEESRTRKALPSLDRDHQVTPKAEKKLSNPLPNGGKEPVAAPAVVFTTQHQEEPVELHQVVPVEQINNISKVKWDECDVVDAVLIGDAIESFLKGSMAYPEKDTKLFSRMTFRKNSFEKKA